MMGTCHGWLHQEGEKVEVAIDFQGQAKREREKWVRVRDRERLLDSRCNGLHQWPGKRASMEASWVLMEEDGGAADGDQRRNMLDKIWLEGVFLKC